MSNHCNFDSTILALQNLHKQHSYDRNIESLLYSEVLMTYQVPEAILIGVGQNWKAELSFET